MIRAFGGVQTMGASSQPVFGTTLTAAVVASVDQHKNSNRPGTSPPPIILTVASTTGMWQNDRILVGLKANFTFGNFGLLDQGTIAGVIDATHISVQGLLNSHAAGEYLVLNEVASLVKTTPINSNGFYLGKYSTVGAADPYTFDGGAPQYYAMQPSTLGDTYQTSEFWILATVGDTFVARFDQV